jgi:hypothetical protein
MANDDERAKSRATYRRALEDIERLPPSTFDPYAGVVVRFGQLPEDTRLFLQALCREDLETLVRLIKQHQFAAKLFHFSRRTILWAIGAIIAGAAGGETILKFIERIVGRLW